MYIYCIHLLTDKFKRHSKALWRGVTICSKIMRLSSAYYKIRHPCAGSHKSVEQRFSEYCCCAQHEKWTGDSFSKCARGEGGGCDKYSANTNACLTNIFCQYKWEGGGIKILPRQMYCRYRCNQY